MKIIKQEDLEEYHMRMIDFHVHRLSLGEELDDCPIIGICYGSGPLITPRLEQVYDVSKTKAYKVSIRKIIRLGKASYKI